MPNQSKFLYGITLVSLVFRLAVAAFDPPAIYATLERPYQHSISLPLDRNYCLLHFLRRTTPALPPTIQLHAQLPGAAGHRYIASGDSTQRTVSDQNLSAVLDLQVLDNATAGKVYYFVDATAPAAAAKAAAMGQVLYQDQIQLLVAVIQEREAALTTQLPAAGIALAMLTAASLPEPVAASEPASVAAQTVTAADPFIVSLLPTLTEEDLAALIRELSGEIPVVIGNESITINTRYTFSTRIQDVERYLHQYYTQLGIAVDYALGPTAATVGAM
ncbi:MAG: hypothetical protein R3E79_14605 [Caldilineaceae bacterium]